jgi:hypothetical protein
MCKDSFMKRCAILVVCAIQRWARYRIFFHVFEPASAHTATRVLNAVYCVKLIIMHAKILGLPASSCRWQNLVRCLSLGECQRRQ